MAPRGKALARRHLICASCSSWIQFDNSGCTNSWAEMRGGACVFTCKGCTEVTRLVGEVGDLRQMMESIKRMITRQGLEEERGVTGIQVARLEETEERGEVRTCDDTRQQLDRRKPEWKGDSRAKFVRR